jgi:putative transposase
MKSTNMLELFNQEIKRRTRGAGFPNNASCLRLIRALSVEQRRCQMHDWICRGDG